MQTIRLEVERTGGRALITRDKLRVDIGAEFYLSVPPEPASVARAAQALGRRSFQADELRVLVEGLFVDALRAVAARSTMEELHEGRAEFAAAVREAVAPQVTGYGLQLDAVALTALDQTPFGAMDENNAFNAEGLRKLAQLVAQSKRERAEIDSETQVSVRRAAMEAARRRLEIELEERRAEIAQTQQVEALMSAQIAEVARAKAEAERASAEARIRMEQGIQAADIAREQAIREAEIARARALEMAEQERAVMVAAKSQEESRAMAEADEARAEAVRAQEAVESARAEAEAQRRRMLALIAAEAEAEAAARRAEIAAATALKTAEDRLQTTELEARALPSAARPRPTRSAAHPGREHPRAGTLGARSRACPAGGNAADRGRDGQARREDRQDRHHAGRFGRRLARGGAAGAGIGAGADRPRAGAQPASGSRPRRHPLRRPSPPRSRRPAGRLTEALWRQARSETARTHGLRAQIELRKRILNGELPGGTRLYEVMLADELNVSRTPVREALSRLAEEGLLERARGGGFVVRSFAIGDVLDMIELRGVLEGTAARLAAERGVSVAKLHAIREILGRLDACFGDDPAEVDLDLYARHNAAFHEALSKLAGSAVLEQEIARVVRLPFASPSAFLPHRARIEALRETLPSAQAQHHAIIEAIVAREGTRAEALAREHTRAARDNVEQLFRRQRRKPDVPGLGLVIN
jgi:DNA-binding GntR family transcriptional regulator